MKNLLFGVIALFAFANICNGQKNNPYNKVGDDFINAYKIISKDYKEGKIKDLNQETLDYYSKRLSLNYNIKLEEFAKILNSIKSTTVETAINNSNLATFSKAILLKSLKSTNITGLVDDVNKSTISSSEKQMVLSTLSIVNTFNTNGTVFPTQANRCWICWVTLGAVTGNAICGPVCGLIGGVAGAILGESEKQK
ncbi:hypothetical protein QWY90_08840 [Flavobacterium paronense]|uniref:Glycine zipper family protein n=1 Tax=Flavobacterium paronense TaxID=1392775 RepID=A0ABV5GAG0_9FLAO|nr:hypothetical protein [Flavobacterium paronense]MDN3677423.1 hypothetical protein [Flavobacterium paronense]